MRGAPILHLHEIHMFSLSLSLPSSLPTHTQVQVVRDKSTETMSFLLTVMSLLTTASWSTYRTLIHDIYVRVSVCVYTSNLWGDNYGPQEFINQGLIYSLHHRSYRLRKRLRSLYDLCLHALPVALDTTSRIVGFEYWVVQFSQAGVIIS